MPIAEILGLGHLVLTGIVAVIGLMIKNSIAQLRIKSLEEERDLKEWIAANYVSKDACDEHRERYGRR